MEEQDKPAQGASPQSDPVEPVDTDAAEVEETEADATATEAGAECQAEGAGADTAAEAGSGDAETPASEAEEPGEREAGAPEVRSVSVDELMAGMALEEEAPEPVSQEDSQIKAILEAVVYVAEEPLTLAQIAASLQQPVERVKNLLDQLIADFDQPGHGVSIREVAGGYKMATKPEHHDAVRNFVKSLKPPLKLSLPALETLAVIAYKQPVTGPEIMEIRGVQGGGVLKTLLDRKLIASAGRKNVVGKPMLYKTTKEFLIQFGLKDLSELPSLKEFEEIRRMAFADSEPPAAEAAPGGNAGEAAREAIGSAPATADETQTGAQQEAATEGSPDVETAGAVAEPVAAAEQTIAGESPEVAAADAVPAVAEASTEDGGDAAAAVTEASDAPAGPAAEMAAEDGGDAGAAVTEAADAPAGPAAADTADAPEVVSSEEN
jgi:segregation and condensation protein B